MTAPEILRIVFTVFVVQLICDLLAHWRIYSKEPYQRSLEKLSRSKFKLAQMKTKEGNMNAAPVTTAAASKKNSKQDRNAKMVQRAVDDHADALANVAGRHTSPNIMTSIVFLVLMRVLGADFKGKVLAVLPFCPFKILRRITARGLEFVSTTDGDNSTSYAELLEGMKSGPVNDLAQAASFTFIYMLTAASVKYYVHQIVSTKPPVGAESLMAMVDSPQGQKMLRAVGIDPVDLKAE